MIGVRHVVKGTEPVSRAAALEERLAEWSSRTGVAVEVWALPGRALPSRVDGLVHGVIGDVLDEVERQGRARAVCVALTVGSGGLRLTVSDDGQGTAAETCEARRAEAARLGGGLSVNAVRGEGTTVSLVLPAGALGWPGPPARGVQRAGSCFSRQSSAPSSP
ncbi:sensor histidine kinase [Nonomuraea sp. NPDC052634]|jgi:nitrate/nitrite-specific signal transduction histidine kinase|uniref:hypothetical protein n=1 Tax=Nonomuraea sp. NPDC052634 TaxID=3155813 RepID=UPI003430211E